MTGSASARGVARVGAAMLLAFGVILADGVTSRAHEHIHTHRKLTAAAFRLVNSEFFRNHPDGEQFILDQIAQGAIDEDTCLGWSFGRNYSFHGNFFSHFLPKLTGVDPIRTPGCSTDGLTASDAATRANMLWGWALEDYRAGNRQGAYRILGRVMHLLEDMTSPAHTHDDPHGKLLPSCDQDADDFENWGHCEGRSDHISDYVIDGHAHRPCGTVLGHPVGEPIHFTITCRLWWALERLYDGRPNGGQDSADPVTLTAREVTDQRNIAYAFVRHVRDITRTFTFFRAHLIDTSNFTDEQPEHTELRQMLRGSALSDCGIFSKRGLCEVVNGWTISGGAQEIGGTFGECHRSEGTTDLTEEWWLGGPDCTRTTTSDNRIQVLGYAYIENTGGDDSPGFIPIRYGCTTNDSEYCGDVHGAVTAKSKPMFARLYGTINNHEDPFVPVAHEGKTQLRIYGDVLYATAVAYGAGLLEAFVAAVDDPSTMALDKTSLRFAAVNDGSHFLSQTSAQTVQLTESGHGHVTWTASSDSPWLTVSPASGTGSAALSIAVRPTGAPATGEATGRITFTFQNTPSTPGPIVVTLSTMAPSTSAPPVGFVDTPLDNTTGVAGSMPITGWSVDDVEVARVTICRAAIAGESPAAHPNCNGAAQIYVGDAVFIEGARPDVQAAYPHVPRSSRGGWGFMVLTNMLPNGGNGAYTFFVYAIDRESQTTLLATRSVVCANAQATKPFGAIDTPGQGGLASGANYINFGWALTPLPKTIPENGSTITVLVDGHDMGHPTYDNFRQDIATLFPGLNNSDGAVGYRSIDTSALSNGLHTIVWVVTDNAGETQGIGSRYFNVVNGTSFVTAAARSGGVRALSSTAARRLAKNALTIWGRRGFDPEAPWRAYYGDGESRVVIRGEEIDRIELQLELSPNERYAGYVRAGGELTPLPVGSSLDAARGRFVWQPGVGFVGAYDLLFVRSVDNRPTSQVEVRIVLAPKATGRVGPQIVVDVPRPQSIVGQPFMIGGWAVDPDSPSGTGISDVNAWAYPVTGGAPIFLGTAAHGPRPDIAAVHGEQFLNAGFGLFVQGLAAGSYDIAVFARSTESSDPVPAKIVRVTIP